jgi:hypothetical protein
VKAALQCESYTPPLLRPEFATLTGGRAYQNNDIVGAIKQAINDAKQSYLLSYAPPPENWDGKYHKVRITCRRKGVKLQTRQGYHAFAEQGASGKQVQDAMEAAILSPFDAAEVGLRAIASPLTGETPPFTWKFASTWPTSNLLPYSEHSPVS